ncbi:MAG: response regulator [Candidatus Obscuribacterales bacterium]|jgi:CheY-like chemotaxis protein|nr:response regulator [Candidatus Obscuribacterales bacterium]
MNESQPERKMVGLIMQKPCILVVDDNPQYAKLFELIAESLGFTTKLVTNCYEAEAFFTANQVDLILMDWVMPEIDGPACTRRIRDLEAKLGKRVPIIGVSGYVQASKESCTEAGMDDFLSVPFTMDELQEKLAMWLPKSRHDLEPAP